MHSLQHLKLIKDNPGVYNFISDEELAGLLLSLIETKSLFKRAKLEIKNGTDGIDGKDGIDGMSREEQITVLNELVSKVTLPTPDSGADGVDGADAEISDDEIQSIVDTVYDALFPILPEPLKSEEIRDRLELLLGEERLSKDSIAGIDEIEKAIEELRNAPVSKGGGLGRRQVTDLINTAISNISNDSSPEFEKVSKNLDSWETASVPPTYDTDGNILVITMKSGADTRLKTLAYTNGLPTSITLSGNLPVGLSDTVKTLAWSVEGEYQGASYS